MLIAIIARLWDTGVWQVISGQMTTNVDSNNSQTRLWDTDRCFVRVSSALKVSTISCQLLQVGKQLVLRTQSSFINQFLSHTFTYTHRPLTQLSIQWCSPSGQSHLYINTPSVNSTGQYSDVVLHARLWPWGQIFMLLTSGPTQHIIDQYAHDTLARNWRQILVPVSDVSDMQFGTEFFW